MTPLEIRIMSEVWTRFERSNCSWMLGTAESNAVEMVRRSGPRWDIIVSCHVEEITEFVLLLLLLLCDAASSATSILDDDSSFVAIRLAVVVVVVVVSADDNTANPKPMMRAAVYCRARFSGRRQ